MNYVLAACASMLVASGLGCAGHHERGRSGAGALSDAQQDGGRIGDMGLQVVSVTATAMSSMWKQRDNRPVTNRSLTVSASLTTGLGQTLCRVRELKLDAVEDERGRDLRAFGTITDKLDERPARANWWRAMPAESRSTSFQAKIEDLDELPKSLSRLAGHIDVVVADEIREVEFELKESEHFVELSPAFSYRVASCTIEKNSVSLRIEYRMKADTIVAGVIEAPALLEVNFADGDPSANVSSGTSWPSEKRIGDTINGEFRRSARGFVGAPPTRATLTALLKARPVRYDFELRDIALTGPGR